MRKCVNMRLVGGLLHETRPTGVTFRLDVATQRISYENMALNLGCMGFTSTYQWADRQDLCIGGGHLGQGAWSRCFLACDAFIRSHRLGTPYACSHSCHPPLTSTGREAIAPASARSLVGVLKCKSWGQAIKQLCPLPIQCLHIRVTTCLHSVRPHHLIPTLPAVCHTFYLPYRDV